MGLTATLLVSAALVAGPADADTLFSVREGDRLVLQNFSGMLVVEGWDRSEVDIRARGSGRVGFGIRSRDGEHRVEPGREARGDTERWTLRVPHWMRVDVRGQELDIRVTAHEGGLGIRTLDGDIDLREVSGEIQARTVDGMLTVTEASGSMELFSLDDDVRVTGFAGDLLRVEANSGDIQLFDLDARVVESTTVDGDIVFAGLLHEDGRYTLVTHDGDITFRVPDGASARMMVTTYEGELTSEFSITLSRMSSGEEFEFTLGDGSAEVRIEAFDGDVSLERIGRTPRGRGKSR